MQKARRHGTKPAPTACRRTVSGSISLPCPGFFSPFPHGTRPLSVSQLCLALADGAAGFGQGSSDPALLRVRARLAGVPRTGLSPAMARLPRRLPLPSLLPRRPPCNPARASTPAVWAGPLSLAATRGVTVVFLSSGYLDVSVRRVGLRLKADAAPPARRVAPFGCPRISGCSRLPAAFRGLPRPSSPLGAYGIPRAPLLARSPPGLSARGPLRLYRILPLPWCGTPSGAPALVYLAGVTLVRTPAVSLCVLLSFLSPILSMNRRGHSVPAVVENVGLEPTTPGLQSRCSSQLSQSPRIVVPGRLELPAPTLSVWCSNRLSYGTPSTAPKGRAFPAEACSAGTRNGTDLREQRESAPERRCSSRTFRYGYLVTT